MLAALLLNYAGLSLLSLAMERHRQPSLRRRVALRGAAVVVLLASVWQAVSRGDWAVGLVQWFAVLMVGGVLMVWLSAYRPRLAMSLGGLGLILGPLVLLGPF